MKTLALHNPLARGPEVAHLQGLLKERGFFHSKVDGIYGPYTANCVLAAKKHYHFPAAKMIPVAGDFFIHVLTTNKSPFHAPILAHHQAAEATREELIRSKILDYATWGIDHEPEIHYQEARPMDHLDDLRHLPQTFDCSTFVTKAYKFAGASDPNGSGYNGYGYTGTLMNHCKHITREMLKPADIVVYGPYPGHHTAIILEPGTDPLTASHGSERGPMRIRVSQERPYQPAGITYLTIF